jgi:hypothetical protein
MSTQMVQRPATGRPPRARWWLLAVIATVLVMVVAAVTAALLHSSGQPSAGPSPGGSAQPSPAGPSSGVPSPAPSATASGPSATASGVPEPAFRFQPLWPFAGVSDAAVWQRGYRAGGSQPWHLDPALTAQSFTRGYLGYTELDRVVSRQVAGTQAWIGVGYADRNGRLATAAVLHLARLGSGADAPWEVVGSRDSTLSLTTPAYGATVTSPLTAGGRITGVDENLRVQVRAIDRPLLGRSAGVPAGGQDAPWSARVAFTAPAGTVLTVAVSTGGHLLGVERFAVTAVRTAGTAG